MCFNHTCQIWGNWALFNYETFAHLLGAREVLFYKHTIIRKKLKKITERDESGAQEERKQNCLKRKA